MASQPNIVCITLDHATFNHYKLVNGAKPILSAYEKLSANGIEFCRARSSHPLCLPCRASMLTGVYAHKHRKTKNEGYTNRNPEYPLIGSFFEGSGYKLGYFGKNHSGFDLTNHFEGYYPPGYGNPYFTDEYKSYLKLNNLPNPIYCQEWGIVHGFQDGEHDLTEADIFNTYSAGVLKSGEKTHEAFFLADMALQWIQKNQNNPYFVRLDFWGPHHAYTVPEEYTDIIDKNSIELYPSFDCFPNSRPMFTQKFLEKLREKSTYTHEWDTYSHVLKRAYEHFSFIDMVVGRFIDALPNKENTVIIYTADHGDALAGHGGFVDKAGDLMEEVMKIPLVVNAPGSKQNIVTDLYASNLDLAPTILDFANIPVPKHMDGKSLKPLVYGEPIGWREDFMAQHYGHFKVNSIQRALYYNNFKYVVTEGETHELYNHASDPFELHNLINEAKYNGILNEMKKRLRENLTKYDDKDGLAVVN